MLFRSGNSHPSPESAESPIQDKPKSESNITFLSDENPLTTKNPLFYDGTLSSPATLGRSQRRRDLLGSDSLPRRGLLRDSFLRFSPGGFGGGGGGAGGGHSWTLPSRLRRRDMYASLRRQVVMDPVQWELELLQSELRASRDEGLDADLEEDEEIGRAHV